VAGVCNGLPRRAEHYVGQVRHHFPDAERRQLTVGDVNEFLSDWGIDEDCLGKQERRYMRFVSRNESASLDSLAAHLGCDPDYVRSQIEQPLRYRGLIRIKSSGRVLTKAGEALRGTWRAARQAQKREE
jgi:Holliday junction resolvasome RuvABC ATP-dependent DNA helicase subunit